MFWHGQGSRKMANEENHYQTDLLALSCHYDKLLWTVTTLWTGALGGLLVYCVQAPKLSLVVIGLLLTPCAMYFAMCFRRLRHKVNSKLSEQLGDLLEPNYCPSQWIVFTGVFLGLALFWGFIIYQNSFACWSYVLMIVVCFLVALCGYYGRSRKNLKRTSTARDSRGNAGTACSFLR